MTKERNCEICDEIFHVKYSSSKVKTCSKPCKNKLASQNTKKQFSSEESRQKHSSITKEAMQKDEVREKYLEGMKNRRDYKKENHPSWGMTRTQESRDKMSKAMQKSKEQEKLDELVKTIRENYEQNKDDLFILDVKVRLPPKSHINRMNELIRLRKEKGGKCIDCGITNLLLLDFVHTDEKVKCVSQLRYCKMKEEASKCELRCKICSTIKNHSENYNSTQNIARNDDKRNVYNRELRKKRRVYIDKIKENVGSCQMCGYKYDGKPYVFDFDHIHKDNKVKGIAWHIGHGSSIKRIHEELARCVMLCRNCHVVRTSKQFGWHITDLV
uniref:HNH endonuclease n=1 Tax=Marseillevirus LCMAC101 TaxID=2506602 RepID=A0A481YRN9_9VIRU|nr:MAG: hypothetical protein LCMAC101_04530 [Marseillevirus LCMAC101]